jgi:hypothetical protein
VPAPKTKLLGKSSLLISPLLAADPAADEQSNDAQQPQHRTDMIVNSLIL